jgi:tetratricopeptide (TPR) repeat protein
LMGRYAQAEPLFLQALEIRSKSLGEDHPDYAVNLYGLANLYYMMGRYAEAEPLHHKDINISRKALGEDHPYYATSLNNLAYLYYKMGRYAEAEPLYYQDINISRKALGEDHPGYATSLNNLANLYYSIGKYTEAEPLYHQSIEIRRKTLGEDHPDYATSLNNMAVLYQSVGKYNDAESLYRQSIDTKRKILGKDPLERLMRFPKLECPERLIVNQGSDILVQLLVKPHKQSDIPISIEYLFMQNQLPEIEMALLAPNFATIGEGTKIVNVINNEDTEVHFMLIPRHTGEQQIRIDFYQSGRRLGMVRRTVIVVGAN